MSEAVKTEGLARSDAAGVVLALAVLALRHRHP
jgi:hypothetical protein